MSVLQGQFSLPDDPREASLYLLERIEKLEAIVQSYQNSFSILTTVPPEKPYEGEVRFADGVSWNPGIGRAFYSFVNGEWRPLGGGGISSGVFTLKDSGAGAGPIIRLYRDSDSVATNDSLGKLEFEGNRVDGVRQGYAEVSSSVHDAIANDGQLNMAIRIAGSMTNGWRFDDVGGVPCSGAISFDGGSAEGPYTVARRRSPTPAVNDKIGVFAFDAHNSAGFGVFYGKLTGRIIDPTEGNETGQVEVSIMKNGTQTGVFVIRSTGDLEFNLNGCRIIPCVGTPEGQISAVTGSMALRSDGGAGTSLYVKETGSGNTGWIGK